VKDRDEARARLAAAEDAAHPGLTVSKCDQCGGLRMALDNPPGLCACNVTFTTASLPILGKVTDDGGILWNNGDGM
jgi:ligand-binding sensor protein